MPIIVTSFVARGGIELSVASMLGASEMIGMTVVQLCAPLFIMRYNRRLLACVAVAFAAAGQFLALFTDQTVILGGLRFIAGTGEGCLFSLAIVSLAKTPNPDRSFGIALACGQICGAALLAAIASVSIGYPAEGAIVVFGLFVLATALCIPALPGREALPNSSRPASGTDDTIQGAPAICGLAGIFLLTCAQGSVWPIIGQIASARGVPQDIISHAFSIAGLGGISGAIFAAVVALRFGRIIPLVLASVCYALCLLLASFDVSFPILAVALLFFVLISITYFMGVLAALDPSGKLSVITGAALPFGMAVGGALSGPVVTAVGFRGATFEGAGLAIMALALVLIALRMKRPSSHTLQA